MKTKLVLIDFRLEIQPETARDLVERICRRLRIKFLQFAYVPYSVNQYMLTLSSSTEAKAIKALIDALKLKEEVSGSGLVDELSSNNLRDNDYDVSPTAPLYKKQRYLFDTDVPKAWRRLNAVHPDLVFGDSNVFIGILDDCTAVWVKADSRRHTHPDLDHSIVGKRPKISFAWDVETDTDVTQLNNSAEHALAVTGIISAYPQKNFGIAGIAGNCPIISVGYGRSTNLISLGQTILWMSGFGPRIVPSYLPERPTPGVAVINCSWSPSGEKGCKTVLDKDAEYYSNIVTFVSKYGRGGKGVLVVHSTGNNRREIDKYWLHMLPDVINVNSTPVENIKLEKKSAIGDHLDVCAPGHPVCVLDVDDKYSKPTSSGSSFAAPQVTGALALALSANPHLEHNQIRRLLHDTADHIHYKEKKDAGWIDTNDDGIEDFSPYFGHGQLNTGRLILASLLTAQNTVFMSVDQSDKGNVFERQGANWNSPDILVEPRLFDPRVRDIRVLVHNSSEKSHNVIVRIMVTEATTCPAMASWIWLGDIIVEDIPSRQATFSAPVEWWYNGKPDNYLILVQLYGADGQLPILLNETNPATIESLLRWSTRIAFKQPVRTVAISKQRSQQNAKFSFQLRKASDNDGPISLRMNITDLPPKTQVLITFKDFKIATIITNSGKQMQNHEQLSMKRDNTSKQYSVLEGEILPNSIPLTAVAKVELRFPAINSDTSNSLYVLEIEQFECGYCVGALRYQFDYPDNTNYAFS